MTKLSRVAVPASVIALLASGHLPFPVYADATIQAHRTRQAELLQANEAILAQADAERRELTAEENTSIDNNTAEFDRLQGEIDRRERVAAHQVALAASRGRTAGPDAIEGDEGPEQPQQPERPQARAPQTAPRAAVPPVPRTQAAGTHGFRNFGDFAQAVRNASMQGAQPDQRLLRNATLSTFSQEGVGSDGGFAVPPDFRAAIMSRVFSEDSLIQRCDVQVTTSNTFTVPVDETTAWGTGGIKAYWTKEAAAAAQSKPTLQDMTLKLDKLTALVPVTEEMLEDAAQIDGYLRSKAPEAIDWELSYALAWGTGAGEPLGYMRAPCLVTQAAEGGQTADTINATNCVKMLSRLPTRSRQNAVWLIHPDAEPQLPLMTIGQQPVYMPPGGLSDAPYGRLLGRPVIPHQVCSTIGDLGDVQLVDLTQYLAVRKAAGVNVQTSMHLWFDQGVTAFKFSLRVAGQPWWKAAQTPRSGSNTMSPFVTLAAR
jgi:HK97 family phage major capsid protein